MKAEDLRSLQAPVKELYRRDASQAFVTLKAEGRGGEGVTCSVEPAARSSKPDSIRRQAAAGFKPAQAICSFRRSSPVPA